MYNSASKTRDSSRKWKPLLVVFGLAGAILAIITYAIVSAPEPKSVESRLPGIPVVGESAQGSSPVSAEYQKKLKQADIKRVGDAWQSGTSALPTIVSSNRTKKSSTPERELENDTRPAKEEPAGSQTILKVPGFPATGIDASVRKPPDAERIRKLAEYAATLQKSYSAAGIEYLPLDDESGKTAEPVSAANSVSRESGNLTAGAPVPGMVVFGHLVSRVDSDSPGPVLADILQGTFNGARLIGRFEKGRDSISIRFDRMTVESDNGSTEYRTVAINAVAVDAKHIGITLPADVDRHIIQNIAVGFVSGFARGLGGALSQFRGSTTTGSDGSVTTIADRLNIRKSLVSASGQAVSDTGAVLQDGFGNRPATITIDAGTPIGILFL